MPMGHTSVGIIPHSLLGSFLQNAGMPQRLFAVNARVFRHDVHRQAHIYRDAFWDLVVKNVMEQLCTFPVAAVLRLT